MDDEDDAMDAGLLGWALVEGSFDRVGLAEGCFDRYLDVSEETRSDYHVRIVVTS